MSVLNKINIPSSCLTFSEMADYLVEYTMSLTQNTLVAMSDIVVESYISEAVEDDNKSSYVYFSEIRESIAKVKSAAEVYYDKVEKKFVKEVETNKSTFKLNKRMINSVKPNQVFRSIHSFDLLGKIRPADNCMKFLEEASKVFEAVKEDKKAISKAYTMLMSELYKHISGLEANDLGDIDANYKDYLIGQKIKIDKNWLEMNYDEVKSAVISDNILTILREMKSVEMKIYDSALNAIENMDKELGNSIHVDHYNIIMGCLNTVHKCNGIILDVYYRRMIEYKGIVTSLNIRSTNESGSEAEGTADEQPDGKFDSTPQELAKTASRNPVSEPTNSHSANMPVAESAKDFIKRFGAEAGIAAGAGAAGVVGTYLATKGIEKVDEMLEKRKQKKLEEEKNKKSEEKH